ncbi:MAG: AraC family transcriptional regulator [Halieaceae bacterium]|jgi:AraC-like DNA-binding protein|nr:AraC family transcriptional regulator [Halieaceae bacterium]
MQSSTLESPRTLLSWTSAIAHALEARGVKSQALFEKANIPYPGESGATERVETRKVSALVRLAVEATADPCFGLQLVPYLHASNFQALGYSLFSSSNLNEFCLRLVRFFRLISQSSQHYLEEEEDAYKLTFVITNLEVCDETADAWMGTLVHFCRSIYRPDFAPQRVDLMRPEPEYESGQFGNFFNAPVNFGAGENAIYFNKDDMFAPLPSANRELARLNDEVIITHLARLERNDVVRRVEASIIQLLPTGDCSREAVASGLNMSARSLLNKLEQRDTSYKEILENLRSVLAQQYMEQPNMPITEITFLLGFSDTSSFSRAFRRWTGQSPSDYRAGHTASGDQT